MTDFHVTMMSSASTHLYPDNHASDFTHELAEFIHLPAVNNYWEVAVKYVLINAKYHNITTSSNKFIVREEVEGTKIEQVEVFKYLKPFHISVGGHSDPGENPTSITNLIIRINAQIPENLQKDFDIEYIAASHSIRVKIAHKMIVRFHRQPTSYDVFHRSLKFPDDKIGTDLTEGFEVHLPAHIRRTALIRLDKPIMITLTGYGKREAEKVKKKVIGAKETSLTIAPSSYFDAASLINTINNTLNEKQMGKSIQVINQHNQIVKIVCKPKFGIQFPDHLAHILGFEMGEWYDGTEFGSHPIDTDHFLNTMSLYIPTLIGPQYIGDTKGPLIFQWSPQKSKVRRNLPFPAIQLEYYPVLTHSFRTLRAFIVNDLGERVSFPKWAQTTIKLHFRPKLLDHY
jgi:hypothetical protein